MGKTLSIQNVNKSFTVDGQKVDVLKILTWRFRKVNLLPLSVTVVVEKVPC